jgi:hypothetical protein
MLNAAAAALFAIGYAWRAGDHVALDKDQVGPARVERGRRRGPHRRDMAGRHVTYHHGMRVRSQADRGGGTTRRR